MNSKVISRGLLAISLFVGIGALVGGTCMTIEPSGKIMQMQNMLIYFQVLPFAKYLFKDYLFSGCALIIVNGITNIMASILILNKKKLGITLGMIFGITLMLWIVIQFIIFPFNFLSTLYFIIGFIQFLMGLLALIFIKQEAFCIVPDLYQDIEDEPYASKNLVVFFSRRGYVKKMAYEKANELKANILEIKTEEKIKGFLGFLWCGRFGLHHWPMQIEDTNLDLSKYDKVYLYSPIWCFTFCSPIRTFVEKSEGKIKNVEIYFVHYMNKLSCKKEYTEMLDILKPKVSIGYSVSEHYGKVIKQVKI